MYGGQAIEITCISYNFILMESCCIIFYIMNIKNLLYALICNIIVGARQSLAYTVWGSMFCLRHDLGHTLIQAQL